MGKSYVLEDLFFFRDTLEIYNGNTTVEETVSVLFEQIVQREVNSSPLIDVETLIPREWSSTRETRSTVRGFISPSSVWHRTRVERIGVRRTPSW